jgi:hypothetical protein
MLHATAVMLHRLAKISPKTIYVNVEQSTKPSSEGSLTQDAIDRAFSGKQRPGTSSTPRRSVFLPEIMMMDTPR